MTDSSVSQDVTGTDSVAPTESASINDIVTVIADETTDTSSSTGLEEREIINQSENTDQSAHISSEGGTTGSEPAQNIETSGSGTGASADTSAPTAPLDTSPQTGDRRESRRHSSPPTSENSTTAEMDGNSGGHVHSRSNPRRQRSGLFGINFDLNFDPSWLVPSNVAGRSISSLSMLPEWARPPVNLGISNRETSNPVTSDARPSHHHGSSGGITGTGAVPTRHGNQSNHSNWNSQFASGSHSSPSLSRPRHTVPAMRSVDEDLDADYNPMSTIDLGAGRDSQSYVIDMDSQMDGWAEDDGPSPHSRISGNAGGNSHSANAAGDSSGEEGGGGGGGRRNSSDINGSPSGQNTPLMADAATGANERPRASELLRDAPETRAFINEISRYTTIRPFIIINFLKGVFDHGTSILAFLALVVTFSHANSLVKKEVSKQRKRNLLYLSMIVINLIACVGFIYYIFNEMELYYALVFLPTSSDLTSFWSLMWAIGVTDYVAKFATVLIKICVVAFPACVLPFQKRGKYYLFIEHSSQLYRNFLPIYPWMFYLVSAYDGTSRMFGLLLAGLYVFFKITDSVPRFKDWLKALDKLLSNVHYGTTPTAKQLDSAGAVCPICHDNFSCPTRLACSHIFCEECVATWFDRERTCPMCRAKVVDDPTYRDGSTSQYVQLF